MAVYKNDPGLKALWSLDEASGVTRLDYTPNNNDLVDGTTGANSTDCKEGAASADFIRANSELLIITNAAQTGLNLTPPFSIVFWVKIDVNDNTEGILTKSVAVTDLSYYVYRLSTSPYKMRIRLSSNGTSYTSIDSDSGVPSAEWHHIGIVADGTDVRFYLDGVLDSASPTAWTAALHASDADFLVGCRMGSDVYESFMDGHLDELALFSRALSAAEVLSINTSGIQEYLALFNPKENVLLRM